MATFTGSNGAEVLPDLIVGPVQGIGNDFVDALDGDDIAIGWSGDDVIRGGAGADVIIGGLLNAAGIITLSGIDAADYTTSVDGVTIDLSVLLSLTLPRLGINVQLTGASQGFGGDAQGDYLVGIVNLIGSNTGGDHLSGSAAANTINGQGGNDVLDGQGGNDILLGGAGNDRLIGGGGADSLQGGAGSGDIADYSGSGAAVTVSLLTGTGSGGDAQGDTLTGIENLVGSGGNDSLTGNAGTNEIAGGSGDDTIDGGDGLDDVAVFFGNWADYTITFDGLGTYTVVDNRAGSPDGTDQIINVEFFRFAGGVETRETVINDVPVLSPVDAVQTDEDTASSTITLAAADQDGDTLSYAVKPGSEPGKGSVALTGNTFIYTPHANEEGADSFIIVVSDGRGGSAEQTVSVAIAAVNDAPQNTLPQSVQSVGEDAPLVLSGVSVADVDAGAGVIEVTLAAANGTLTVGSVGGANVTGSGTASVLLSGTLAEINGTLAAANNVVFQGLADFHGTASVTMLTSDNGNTGSGGVQTDSDTIAIDVTEENDSTVSADDSYNVAEDTPLMVAGPGVLGNDTDADGDVLSAVVVSGPAHGSLVLNADGSFTYTPDADFNGSDSFTYKGNDGTADGNVATVSLTVGSVNDAPVGSPTAMLADGFEDQPYIVSAADLLAGFSDPEGDPLSVQNLAVVGGSVADNGDGTYTITLPPDRAGSVTLTYQVSDGQGGLTPAVQGYQVIGDGDEATFTGDTAGAVVEAGLAGPGIPTATGTLSVRDIDGPDTLVPIAAGSRSIWGYGSVEMTKDGAWTYTLDNSHPTVDALGAGETLSDRFVAVAADGTQQVVVITISGADDGVRSVPGTSGDDTLASTSADETIAGGRGLDTAVFTGALAGYELTRLGDGSVRIVDIDPSDGDDGTDTLSSIELLRFGTADPVTLGSLVGQPDWTLDKADVALTAAAYQFFTGALPSAAGFEYLILSSANPNDLNDPYYAGFNLENLYLNFASNLGTAGAGASFFDAEYGALSFEATVKAAYLDIVGTELTGAALDVFLDAESFYQSVAASRVVRPGVDLAEATKIVAIGSILHEAVKADSGGLGQAVNDFAAIVNAAGTAEDFGHSLFAMV